MLSGLPFQLPFPRARCFEKILGLGLAWILAGLCSAQAAPSTLHGSVTIEAGSGAMDVAIPLGPGIGDANLGYAPVLTGRFQPLVGLASRWDAGKSELAPALLETTGFVLSPGTLDWRLAVEEPLTKPAEADWSYPDGTVGSLAGTCAHGADPSDLRRRYGYGITGAGVGLPHPVGSSAPEVLEGVAGEHLLVVSGQTLDVETAGVDGRPVPWRVPALLLVIREPYAFEYAYSECGKPGPWRSSAVAHYRLSAIRDPASEPVRFSYGGNGVDFDATWKSSVLSVTLEGVAAIPPALALDDALCPLDPEAARFAYRDTLARLRVCYQGGPSYAVTALARPGFHTAEGGFAGGFQTAFGPGDGLQDSFRNNLQVTAVHREASSEWFWFSYDKAATQRVPRPDGLPTFLPTVLREIGAPGCRLGMTWDERPCPGSSPDLAGISSYGVSAAEIRNLAEPCSRTNGTRYDIGAPEPIPGQEGPAEAGIGAQFPNDSQGMTFLFMPNFARGSSTPQAQSWQGLKGGCPQPEEPPAPAPNGAPPSEGEVWFEPPEVAPGGQEVTLETVIGTRPPPPPGWGPGLGSGAPSLALGNRAAAMGRLLNQRIQQGNAGMAATLARSQAASTELQENFNATQERARQQSAQLQQLFAAQDARTAENWARLQTQGRQNQAAREAFRGHILKSVLARQALERLQAQAGAGIPPGYLTIVIPNAQTLVGKPIYGSGTCVDLAKAFGAPQTSLWSPGPAPDPNTALGTLVATFYANNGTTFANQSGYSHVGALLGVDSAGITLLDQYRNPPVPIIQKSIYFYGGTKNYNADARNYHVVLIKH